MKKTTDAHLSEERLMDLTLLAMGEGDPGELARVQAHVDGCDEGCKEALAAQRDVARTYAAAPAGIPEGLPGAYEMVAVLRRDEGVRVALGKQPAAPGPWGRLMLRWQRLTGRAQKALFGGYTLLIALVVWLLVNLLPILAALPHQLEPVGRNTTQAHESTQPASKSVTAVQQLQDLYGSTSPAYRAVQPLIAKFLKMELDNTNEECAFLRANLAGVLPADEKDTIEKAMAAFRAGRACPPPVKVSPP